MRCRMIKWPGCQLNSWSACTFSQPYHSLLCALCLAKDPMFLHLDIEDDQTGRVPRLCWAHRSFCLFCHALAHMNEWIGKHLKSQSYPVKVHVGIIRHVIVKYYVHSLYIHASSKQVGGYQDSLVEILELLVAWQPEKEKYFFVAFKSNFLKD